LLGTFIRRHLDEGEAARPSGLSIHDDRHAGDFSTVRPEGISQ